MYESLVHSFRIDFAKQFGLEEAILLNHFAFWMDKNEANSRNFQEGRYWTYSSFTGLNKLFPYMSNSTLKRKIKNLQELGILLVGKFNTDASGVSNWYSLDCVKLTQVTTKLTQVMGQSDTAPIITVITSNKTVIETDSLKTKQQQYNTESNFNLVYSLYPRKMGRRDALRHFQASVKTEQDLANIQNAVESYNTYILLNKTEEKFIKHASTWFRNWPDWVNYYKNQPVKIKAGAAGREL